MDQCEAEIEMMKSKYSKLLKEAEYKNSNLDKHIKVEAEKQVKDVVNAYLNKKEEVEEKENDLAEEKDKVVGESQHLDYLRGTYKEEMEKEVYREYDDDVRSGLKRYGKCFVIAAVIICWVLCGTVHHNTQAKYTAQVARQKKQITRLGKQVKSLKAGKSGAAKSYSIRISNYKNRIERLQKDVQELEAYKKSVKNGKNSTYYLCTKDVTGKIVGGEPYKTVTIEKGEIVRELSSGTDNELVMYDFPTYGYVKVKINADKFIDHFDDVDIPIGK